MPKLSTEGREQVRKIHAESKQDCEGCGAVHSDDCPRLAGIYEQDFPSVEPFKAGYVKNESTGGIDFQLNARAGARSARGYARYYRFPLQLEDGTVGNGWRAERVGL